MLIATNYHYIRESFDAPYPGIYGVTPAQFEAQLMALAKEGTFVSGADVRDHLSNGAALPERALLVTFDDGLKEQYDVALPILDRLGIPALFFVNPRNTEESVVSTVHKIHLLRSTLAPEIFLSSVMKNAEALGVDAAVLTPQEKAKATAHNSYDAPDAAILKHFLNFLLTPQQQRTVIDVLFASHFDESKVCRTLYMSREQLTDLASRELLGSHTYDHVPTGLLSEQDMRASLQRSYACIQSYGQEPFAVSYPYGSYDASAGNVGPLAQELGYTFGFTMEKAMNTSWDHPTLLARFDCNDLPEGKANMFEQGTLFSAAPTASWFSS